MRRGSTEVTQCIVFSHKRRLQVTNFPRFPENLILTGTKHKRKKYAISPN